MSLLCREASGIRICSVARRSVIVGSGPGKLVLIDDLRRERLNRYLRIHGGRCAEER